MHKKVQKLTPLWRAFVEVGFIIFLFYANLLMGEFTGSGLGETKGMLWAIENIFNESTLVIAIFSALVGYVIFEFLRNRI